MLLEVVGTTKSEEVVISLINVINHGYFIILKIIFLSVQNCSMLSLLFNQNLLTALY